MEALGEFLKKGREKAGVTLDELAQRTRIRIENLDSLEKEDLENLPSDAYVRGFVRQVCREIGLSPNEGLVRYEMLRAQSGPPDEITWAEERVDETPGRLERALEDPERVVRIARKSYQWAGIAIGAGALVLVLMFGWRLIKGDGSRASAGPPSVGAVREPRSQDRGELAAAEPAPRESARPKNDPKPQPSRTTEVESPAPKPVSPAKVVPKTAPQSARPIEATLSDAGTFSLPSDQVPVPIRREPAPRATATQPASEPAAAPPRETREQAAPAPSPGGKLVLDVHALRAVNVTVLLDGAGQPRRASLAAGERRQWKAARFFEFTASDGGAVRLSLDGRDLGAAGEDGRGAVRTLKRGAAR